MIDRSNITLDKILLLGEIMFVAYANFPQSKDWKVSIEKADGEHISIRMEQFGEGILKRVVQEYTYNFSFEYALDSFKMLINTTGEKNNESFLAELSQTFPYKKFKNEEIERVAEAVQRSMQESDDDYACVTINSTRRVQ